MKPLTFSLLPLACSLALAADPPRIEAVDEVVRQAIEQREVAGAVTLFSEGDELRHLSALGEADLANGRAMSPNTVFWIASMTKPVTGVAVLMLQDEGKLSVEDPVAKYLPEFKNLKGPDGEPATITIAQCLSHTSGLPNLENEERVVADSLETIAEMASGKTLEFEPDSRWRYCQSSINTAARVVEVVSGEAFEDFLEERLFAPLGMGDTTFFPEGEQLARVAVSYRRTEEGELVPAPLIIPFGDDPGSAKRAPLANAGLFSTAPDFWQFCRMLANGGEIDGKRYLSEAAVKELGTIRTGDLETGFTPGNGWGLGACVVREPQGVTAVLSPGSYGHGGAFGTQAWIDPVKGRVFLLMVQRANFPNSDGSALRAAFQDAAVR